MAILQRGKRGQEVAPQIGPEADWGADRWASFPDVYAPWQQVGHGAYWLNQFPAYYNQPQLHSGTEWLAPGMYWFTPTRSTLPYWEQTQRPANIAGGQRTGQSVTGLFGPLKQRAAKTRVTQAQVAQSGAGALSWAQQLTGG